MIRIGIAASVFFWLALTLATHPEYLKSFVVCLALVVPLIFLTIYLRALGSFIIDIWRYSRIRLFVWQAKKEKNSQARLHSSS
jgi:hypothetical protein